MRLIAQISYAVPDVLEKKIQAPADSASQGGRRVDACRAKTRRSQGLMRGGPALR